MADLSGEQDTVSEHSHSANTQFHDPAHAAEFDRRAAMSDIRGQLAERLIEAMATDGLPGADVEIGRPFAERSTP